MKKLAHLFLAVSIVMVFSSFVYADDFEMGGRELSPGINLGVGR